jgi:hypothetical protein
LSRNQHLSLRLAGPVPLLALLLAAFGSAPAAGQAQGAAAAPATAPDGFQASVSARSGYVSDLRQGNQQQGGSAEEDLAGSLQWQRLGPTGGVQLRYQPRLQLFSSVPQLNSLNQMASLDGAWQPAPRWSLSAHLNGGYLRQLPEAAISGLQPELLVQPQPVLPRTREATGAGQLKLSYALSARSSLAAYGGYSETRFPNASQAPDSLNGVRGDQSGLAYTFTATPRTQWGLRLDQQNDSIGHSSHLAAESLTASYSRALTPLLRLDIAAGPEYSQVRGTYVLNLGSPGLPVVLTDRFYRVRTYPRLSGSLSRQDRNWPWSVSVASQVSSADGLPFPAALLDGGASLQPYISPDWRLRLGVHASQFRALTTGGVTGQLRMGAVTVELERRLSNQFSVGVDFSYVAQRSQGSLPMPPAVNRGVGGVRLNWTWPPRAEAGQ